MFLNAIESCSLIVVIPLVLLTAGYWLAARLGGSPAERLAAAMLAGLAALLWMVSVVNLALPLAGGWGWVCLAPAILTLARRETRRGLIRDLVAVAATRRGAALGLAAAAFLGFLLWPLLRRPDLVFYDGTGGHDAFFWITGAEHLKRQNYLQAPVADAVYPLYHSVEAITGWRPVWGRMGAEGLLALTSNLVDASPLKIYVAATAALFAPWLAAVFLVARTFLVRRITLVAALGLIALQPLFVYFHSNANLPNLLGAITGATVVIAVARALAGPEGRGAWLGLVALSVHGLLCSYPEMLPAIALPSALLWARSAVRARGAGHGWRELRDTLLAVIAGVALNPASAIRGWNGFRCSLEAAAHPERWPAMFEPLRAAARWPAMATLSFPLGKALGAAGGVVAAALLLFAAAVAIRHARDRFGAAAMLAGLAAMVAFTLASGFDYGWQKSVQFAAVFIAALFVVAAVRAAESLGDQTWRSRWTLGLAAGVALLLGAATYFNGREAHKWSERKFLTRDWFEARTYARETLRNAPVLIDAATFSRPFFYGMWATYFLTDSRVSYPAGDPDAAGYLQPSQAEPPPIEAPPRAILVSSEWAAKTGAVPTWRNATVALLPGPWRPPPRRD